MVPSNHAPTRLRPRSMRDATATPCADRKAMGTEGAPVVAPNRWTGECGYLVGPFTCRRVAERFANAMVEFGQYECVCERVVTHAGAYYVEAVGVAEGRALGS